MMDLLPQKVVGKTMNSAGSVLFMTTFAIDQDAVTASIRMSSWCECRLVGALSSATAVSESARWRAVSGDLESIRRAALTYKNALDESTVV